MNKLGFLGAGNMAEAIIKGILKAELLSPKDICFFDPNDQRTVLMQDTYGLCSVDSSEQLSQSCDYVLLAIKPQVASEVLPALASDRPIFISIMAGKTISVLQSLLGSKSKIVRVMPNTPALLGLSMSGLCASSQVSELERSFAFSMFDAVGKVIEVPESLMDTVTAVSGSGPAYVYYLAEAMIEAAQKQGLSPEQAKLSVNQTLLGASQMLNQSADSATELRQKVSSPGGTTVAALDALQVGGFAPLLDSAIAKARQRSEELS